MSLHGYARYSADVDVLTMSPRVLRRDAWAGLDHIDVRLGDFSDPLAGVVRVGGDSPTDLIVGKGPAMDFAVRTAELNQGRRVATPLALILLKLEAGGTRDRQDVVALAQARVGLGLPDPLVDVEAHLDLLSDWGRSRWELVKRVLAS